MVKGSEGPILALIPDDNNNYFSHYNYDEFETFFSFLDFSSA